MKESIIGLLDWLFPPLCAGCSDKLVQGEKWICTICLSSFPETDSHKLIDNAITHHFIGKAPITFCIL